MPIGVPAQRSPLHLMQRFLNDCITIFQLYKAVMPVVFAAQRVSWRETSGEIGSQTAISPLRISVGEGGQSRSFHSHCGVCASAYAGETTKAGAFVDHLLQEGYTGREDSRERTGFSAWRSLVDMVICRAGGHQCTGSKKYRAHSKAPPNEPA
jgi:hypothetical protein